MTNIILCGGNGTRLWPLSRALMPKQFIKVFNNKSLFQLTVERNSVLCKNNLIISNIDQYFLALDQQEELDLNIKSKYILEPVARNTAPAIALACMALDYDEVVFVTPSDHLIKDEEKYIINIKSARDLASTGNLVTFGIKPTYPETGFGYIEADHFDVISFKEKPDIKTANDYISKGNYYWNSGMFMFKAGVFLEEIKKHSLDIYEKSLIAFENKKEINNNQFRIKQEDMVNIPEDSIDYAVMEKTNKAKVVLSDIDWSDLGGFDSLSNEIKSNEDVININAKNNFVISNRQVAIVDNDDLIVIDTPDALLVSKKGSSNKVRDIVAKLKHTNPYILQEHTLTYRPWGTYEILLSCTNYKIKRIMVKPQAQLSLQKHLHRNEHWVVVTGTATIQVGDKKSLLRVNESTYIKMGEIHRLSNEGKIPIELIEVQVGEYLGEDDIIRIDDVYNRGNS
jgi:mannose-1-phosphate guanylyltransferase